MNGPFPRDDELQRAAYQAALAGVRGLWAGKGSSLHPGTRLESLSDVELQWIVAMAISQWICERSKQACDYRCSHEAMIKTLAGEPEPWEHGAVKAALPALADVVEDLGVNEKTIGEFSRDEIGWFVWSCFKAVEKMRVDRDETPGPIDLAGSDDQPDLLAGAG